MTSIANPNWLAVAGTLYVLCGAILLIRSAATNVGALVSDTDRAHAGYRRQLSAWSALPLLTLGLFMQAASQFSNAPLSPAMLVIVLSLAYAMLLYACLEDSLIDRFFHEHAPEQNVPKIALPPPAAPSPIVEVSEIASQELTSVASAT